MSTYNLADRMTVVAGIIDALHKKGSWCGETHIQKSIYLLQHACNIPLNYEYVLYKHGPYSFELSSDLGAMRGSNFVELVFPLQGYGPSVCLTKSGNSIFDRSQQKLAVAFKKIELVAEWLGKKDVKYLERIATAFYVHSENPLASSVEKVRRLKHLKPHINDIDASSAVSELSSELSTLAA